MEQQSTKNLLSVNDLRTYFHTDDGVVRAVDGVSFNIRPGETFALVGESGCGKSVTSFSILQLVPTPPGRFEGGEIIFRNQDLLKFSDREMRTIRGGEIGMIFQEPMTSLNPVFTCGAQIVEAVRLHRKVSARQARQIAVEMLDKVGIEDPARRFSQYPHQLSGGMRQRIMIAMALVCHPDLLIADEPTTALDVTIQAQILELLAQLQRDLGMSILLITHDLAVVAESAHRVAVMYAGRIVETTDVDALFANPSHPYTQGLFRSIPKLGQEKKERLDTIPGNVPNPLNFPAGCAFHPRCPLAKTCEKCMTKAPPLEAIAPGHQVACWVAQGKGGDA